MGGGGPQQQQQQQQQCAKGSGLEGKVVMVTGASSGIGRELCVYLGCSAGCRIVAAARRTERLESLCDEINGVRPGHSSFVELDVRAEESAVEASVRKAWEAFGRIDVLINNAGVLGNSTSSTSRRRGRCCLDLDQDEWDVIMKTNLTGLRLVSKHVCRLMMMRNANANANANAKQKGGVGGGGGGSILNVSSAAVTSAGASPGGLAYIASKTAVNALTKVMALELGKHNIRVNAIAPGYFKSEITSSLMEQKWLDRVARRTVPLRSYGTTDPALTSIVRYLIHDSSAYVNGNVFVVDAGTTIPGVPLFSCL